MCFCCIKFAGPLKLDELKPVTPVNVKRLHDLLKDFPDQKLRRYILEGFQNGFRIGYHGPRQARDCQNLKTVQGREHLLWEKIQKEIQLGRYKGPFTERPLQFLRDTSQKRRWKGGRCLHGVGSRLVSGFA